MTQNWVWTSKYLLVIVIALLLGGAISQMTLFTQTTLGTPKMTVAALVEFISYTGALYFLWLLTQKAATQFRAAGDRTAFLGHTLVPLATLVIVTAAYTVGLVVLKPFLSGAVKSVYNWIFILAITGAAIYLLIALFNHGESFVSLFKSGSRRT